MSTVTTDVIHKTVLVDFTPADVVFEPRVGGSFYEATEGTAEWGRVTAWEPPNRLVPDWKIGKCAGTEVEVRFSPEGPGARVELEHRGWERVADASGWQGYAGGWDVVLAPFVESASRKA